MINKLLYISLLCLAVTKTVNAQPSEAIVNSIQKSIVRVESGGKVGTGFLWKQHNWVVAALHLIGNRNKIDITLIDGVKSAHVKKILKANDLVLLEMEEAASSSNPVLSSINGHPALHSELYTIGYNGGGNINNIIDRSLRLGFSRSNKLSGLLPESVRNSLSICKSPDPDIDILYLDGSLLPGFSGAPIVDLSGNLVAVADGGLDRGASSVSWGIPATQLNRLEFSAETAILPITCGGIASNVTFSADHFISNEELKFIRHNGFNFVKTKTRTIRQMMATVDDPNGLQQLVNGFAANLPMNYLEFRYDIYEDLSSGGVICVPEGSNLQTMDDLMVVEFGEEKMAFVAWATNVNDVSANLVMRYNPSAVSFQQKIMQRDGGNLSYQIDWNWSYRQPLVFWGGTAVNRASFYGNQPVLNSFGQQIFVPKTFSFQTLIGRGNVFIGAAALHDEHTQEYINGLQSCVVGHQCFNLLQNSGCITVCRKNTLYAQLVLGTHMAGFSNNYNTNQ